MEMNSINTLFWSVLGSPLGYLIG